MDLLTCLMTSLADHRLPKRNSLMPRRVILDNSVRKFFPGAVLVTVAFLLVGCQEEQASDEKPQTKPVEYVFDKSIADSGKILCAASAGRKQRLNFLAFRVEADERDGGENFDWEPLGTNKECDLSKLSYGGLGDYFLARKEVVFNIGITFRLNLKSFNTPPTISISRHAENMREDINFQVKNLSDVCASLTKKTSEHGFVIIERIENCDKKIKYLPSSYTFAGINQTETIPSRIECTILGGVYPNGACFLRTWYKNYSTMITFSATDLKHWRQIRQQAFDILDSHLVALINPYHCIGEFCKKIGRD